MEEHELSVMFTIADPKDPPTEFMIFHAGENKTLKGPVIVNARALASVFAMEKRRERKEIPFDYAHAAVQGPQNAQTAKASAWGTLAERNGDFWVEKIQWTPAAHTGIANREYRFTSPAVMIDTASNELRSLTNIALTNLPATVGQKPLVASTVPSGPPAVNRKESPVDEKLQLAMMLSLGVKTAEEIPAALEALQTEKGALFTAAQENHTSLAEAQGKLKALAEATEIADHAAIMKQLSEERKLTPGMTVWAQTQSAESLKVYGEGATPLFPEDPDKNKVKGATSPEGKKNPKELDADTIKIFSSLGLTEEEFLAEQKHLLSEPSFWESDPTRGPAAAQESN